MQNDPKRQKSLVLAGPLPKRRHFIHPTVLPLLIGAFLYSGFSLFGKLFHIQYPEWLKDGLFVMVTFSMGVSGAIILKRGVILEGTGIIKRSWYAYSMGMGLTIFGFGATLLSLYELFIK